MPIRCRASGVLVGCIVLMSPPLQADSEALGSFKSWTATKFSEQDRNSCMLWSQPEKSTGDYTRRGEVFMFVTHRPAESSFDKVSYETGYTYRKDSEVTVQIGNEQFKLFTDGTTAWTFSKTDDQALVKAMRAGSKMTVKGVSSRGTLTEDEFSLLGFSAAHRAIGEAASGLEALACSDGLGR